MVIGTICNRPIPRPNVGRGNNIKETMTTHVGAIRYEVRYVGAPYGNTETGHKTSKRFLSRTLAREELRKQQATAYGYRGNSRLAIVTARGDFVRWDEE
jgi:hypothetical protein